MPAVRRKRLVVEGFQAQFVVVLLAWFAILLLVLVAALFAPWIYRLTSANTTDRLAAADQFLMLHHVAWPSLLGVLAAAAAVILSMSHRVAGPLYRFRRVFCQVADGHLDMRVTLRRGDYLRREASDLDAMVTSLRTRIRDAQASVGEASGHLGRMSRFGWLPSPDELQRTQDAIERAREALAPFQTDEPGTAAPSATTGAEPPVAVTARRDAGFTMVETLLACGMISLLVALAAPRYASALNVARIAKGVGDVRTISNEIVAERIRTGCTPSPAGVGYGSLLDPWQRPYVFGVIEHPGKGKKGTSCAACSGSCIGIGAARKDGRLVPLNSDFDLYSVGADGQAGTTLNNPKSFDDIVRANDGGYVGLGKDY